MNLIRDVEFKSTGFGFTDEYGQDKELTKIADRIIRAVQASSYAKAWIPLVQGQIAELGLGELDAMHADSDVLYILPDSITAKDYELKYAYTDGSYTKNYGAIDGNVVVLKLDDSFNKDNFLKLLEKVDEATPESAVAEARRAYEKAQVQKFVDSRIKARREEIDRDYEKTGEELSAASNKLIYLARRKEELALLMIAYGAKGDEQDKVEAEIKELFDDKNFRSVRFDENLIVFTTGPLGIKDAGGKYHPIGEEFEVEIHTDNAKVIVKNLRNHLPAGSPKAIPHPHCDNAGKPCLGNISTVIPELIAAYDILGLWQISQSFLTSYAPDDSWGKQLRWWPYIGEGGEKIVSADLTAKVGEERNTFYCDHCKTDHPIPDFTPVECPVCHETFCLEAHPHPEFEGVFYCSDGCVEAFKIGRERGIA